MKNTKKINIEQLNTSSRQVNIILIEQWAEYHAIIFNFVISRRVDAFDYDLKTGEISNRRTAIDVQTFEPMEHVSTRQIF